MKKMYELLQEMLANIEIARDGGLCLICICLYCGTGDEFARVMDYIDNNRPFPLSSISAFWEWLCQEPYYWAKGDIKHREKWLIKHIARCRKKNL